MVRIDLKPCKVLAQAGDRHTEDVSQRRDCAVGIGAVQRDAQFLPAFRTAIRFRVEWIHRCSNILRRSACMAGQFLWMYSSPRGRAFIPPARVRARDAHFLPSWTSAGVSLNGASLSAKPRPIA